MSLKTIIGGGDQIKGAKSNSESDLENNGRKQIIDANPTATMMIATIQQ
jgi:hypothetical protein